MTKKRILINALMSVFQTLLISVILFILYRFLMVNLGVEGLGIWSLVLASTSVTQVANLGLSAGVVKFVSKYIALKEDQNVALLIQTAFLSSGILMGLVLVVVYPFIVWVLVHVVPLEFVSSALEVLPYAMFSLWTLVVIGVFQSGIDGCQRIDVRSMIISASSVANLLLCFALVPKFGLLGVAYARTLQNVITLIVSWLVLRRCVPSLPIFPFKWDKKLFLEIFGYGLNFQIIAVTTMLGDPITKVLLTKYGGLISAGYFEMASKMIRQLRALIISANQVVVPTVAGLHEVSPDKKQPFYYKSYQAVFYISLPAYALIVIFAPVIAKVWIGWHEPFFIFSVYWLSLGAFFTTIAGPAYFMNLGSADLKWNVVGHLSAILSNTILGVFLGMFFGGMGVVTAMSVGLVINSVVINISYYLQHGIPLKRIVAGKGLFWSVIAAIFFVVYINKAFLGRINLAAETAVNLVIFLTATCVFLWNHPGRKIIARLFLEGMCRKET